MKLNFLLLFVVFVSCSEKNQKKIDVNYNDSRKIDIKASDSLKKSAIDLGDNYAYGLLVDYYTYTNEPNEMKYFIELSKKVANKNNSCGAYYEVYKTTIRINSNGVYNDSLFDKLSREERDTAFSYVKKGVKTECPGCIAVLENLYRKGYGVAKSEKKADSLYNLFVEKFKFKPSKK